MTSSELLTLRLLAGRCDVEQPMTPRPPDSLHQIVTAAARDAGAAIDWRAVDQAGMQRSGLPVVVAVRGGGAPVASVASPAIAARPAVAAAGAPVPLWPGAAPALPAPTVAQGPTPISIT